MKTKLLIAAALMLASTALFAQQPSLRLTGFTNDPHKGLLEFGLADLVFENSFENNGYSLQVKNWKDNGYINTLKINSDGKVGIGTTSPTAKLEVKGDLKLNDGSEAHKGQITFGSGDVIVENSPVGGYFHDLQFKHWNGSGYTNSLRLNSNGRVGIGTTTGNLGAMLTVAGDIVSREITVTIDAGAGPDFVFNNDYNLRSLNEVEEYINDNKHLPDVAPASEMEKDGVALGKMDMKLLQKVEELTLYLIEQNKQLIEQQKKIEVLESKLKALTR